MGVFSKKLICLSLLLSCQARRQLSDVQSLTTEDLQDIQADEGVVRQIECVAAYSIVKLDDSDLGVSLNTIGKPVEGLGQTRFLTPLSENNYVSTCETALEAALASSEKKIAEMGAKQADKGEGDADSYDTKEEIAGGSWQPLAIYDQSFRDGACKCRDIQASKLNRPIYCTQKFRFDLKTGSNAVQYCIGFHTSVVDEVSQRDLPQVITKNYCQSKIKSWGTSCKKQKDLYKQSLFYKTNGFNPGPCRPQLQREDSSCVCETDPMPVRAIQGQRFYCLQSLSGEEAPLDLNSADGQVIYEGGE